MQGGSVIQNERAVEEQNVVCCGEIYEMLDAFRTELSTVYIVSQAEIVKGAAPENAFLAEGAQLAVLVEQAEGKKCDRCWGYSKEGVETDGGFLCERCRKSIE